MKPPVVVLLALLAPAVLPLVGSAAPAVGEFLVAYKEGSRDEALLAIQLAGGTVEKVNDDIRVAVVSTSDPGRLSTTLGLSPHVEYTEPNDPAFAEGTQWNGADWNTAEVNGADWNGADWNGVDWNGAEWNGAEWNGDGDPTGSGADAGLLAQWGLWAIDAPRAWQASSGSRAAALCVIDSGVAWDHPDLRANMWRGPGGARGYNALNESAWPYDDAGHGTHVAGVAAAGVHNDFGVSGVGNVRIMPAKVLDANGHGDEGDVAFALVWCANHGADVSLMALGVTEWGPTLDRAVAYAAARDVLLVASAGNAGPCERCVGYPAKDARVLAVSATTINGTLAPFSSQGPEVDLAAPGEHVLSTFLANRFAWGSGTSQAAAFAAGAAALLRDARPTLSAVEARALLEQSADDLGALGPDDLYGRGELNVRRATSAP